MRDYIDCKKFINNNNINSRIEYILFQKKFTSEIPVNPTKFYKEWIDWYAFLNKNKKIIVDFNSARKHIQKLNLKSISEYRKWYKANKPTDMPNSPDSFYKEWISWSDFLGHDYIATSKRSFMEFSKAKEIVATLNIKTQKEWQEFIIKNKKKYHFLPTCPEQIYDEFISYNDWLDTDKFHSNGERTIEKLLNKLSIRFINQYKFDLCKYKRKLPFDFYIPSLNICVEYDGEQHFEPRFGEEEFIKTQERDKIKTQYCLNNSIKLIRIAYFENIEEKLILSLK